jgi:hypothetical protein
MGERLLELEAEVGPEEANRLWNDRRGPRQSNLDATAAPPASPSRGRGRVLSWSAGCPNLSELDDDEILERDARVRRERPWLR